MTARRTVLIGVTIAALIAAVAAVAWLVRAPAPRYNVLLITLDTTRADRLGCYGYAKARTPALDALAASGVRFTHALAHVPLTLPSHATMLTGLLPPEHGLRDNGRGKLPPGVHTLAESLAERGYRTAAFVGSFVLDKRFGLDRGFAVYDDTMDKPTDPANLYTAERPANVVADRAIDWLEQTADAPFFAWVHFYDPHGPYEPPEPWRSELADPYDGEIAFVDSQVRRLLDFLDRRGLRNRTILVVAGDHGEAFGEHHERKHGALIYQTTLHVPLILSVPGRTAPGVAENLVGLADIAPTVLDALRLRPAASMSGRSLLATPDRDRALYAESEFLLAEYGWAPLYSLVTPRWKYIDCPQPELYDLTADPTEGDNRAAANLRAAADLARRLHALRSALTTRTAPGVELDAAAVRALQELGYLSGTGSPAGAVDPAHRADPKAVIHIHNACDRATELQRAGRHEDAIAAVLPFAAASARCAAVDLALYKSYYALARWAEARRHIEAYLRVRPDDRLVFMNLGTVLLYLGKPDEAARVLTTTLRLPQSPLEAVNAAGASMVALTAHIRLGLAYRRLGQPGRAIEQWSVVLRDDPKNALMHKSIADVCSDQGQFDEAATHYKAALKLPAATVQVSAVELGAALASADAGAKGLGLVRERKYAEAIATWRDTAKLDPANRGIARTLAWWLATCPNAALRDGPEAVRLAESAGDDATGRDARYLDILAAACAEAGDFAKAVATAERALAAARSASESEPSAKDIEARLVLYRASKPYHQSD